MSKKTNTATAETPNANPTPSNEEVSNLEETVDGQNIFGSAVDNSFNFETSDEGELFGGSYPRLMLNPNDVSAPLIYRKDTEIPLDGGKDENGNETTKMQTVYVVEVPSGELVTCPIAAIFMKHFKEANIEKGDTFRIKRYPDASKKRGRGAGKPMQVYAVRVTSRASSVEKEAAAES